MLGTDYGFRSLHGERHWRSVAIIASELVRETPEASPTLALLFALFHDSMRENDGHDPEHGRRGADLAINMQQRGLIRVDEFGIGLLAGVCRQHSLGLIGDPLVGVCWDADRLDLSADGDHARPKRSLDEGGARTSRKERVSAGSTLVQEAEVRRVVLAQGSAAHGAFPAGRVTAHPSFL